MATSLLIREQGPLNVRVDQGGDSLAVKAVGELDLSTAAALEESVRYALQRDASSIVLDLAGVSFIDLPGLRVVLWAADRGREDGDRIRIRLGSGAVRRMIDTGPIGFASG